MPKLSHYLSRFQIDIYMYPEHKAQHKEAHIHVYNKECSAVYNLDGILIAGDLPRKKVRDIVTKWIIKYKDVLQEMWDTENIYMIEK